MPSRSGVGPGGLRRDSCGMKSNAITHWRISSTPRVLHRAARGWCEERTPTPGLGSRGSNHNVVLDFVTGACRSSASDAARKAGTPLEFYCHRCEPARPDPIHARPDPIHMTPFRPHSDPIHDHSDGRCGRKGSLGSSAYFGGGGALGGACCFNHSAKAFSPGVFQSSRANVIQAS